MKKRITSVGLGLLLLGWMVHRVPANADALHDAVMGDAHTADSIWHELMTGNLRFQKGQAASHDVIAKRKELVNGQKPRVIVLGCADSRVSPEIVFDQALGDLFVVRTAGNIADPIALGSIEYAVEHLGSSVLVVLGHEKCGAVAAAADGGKMPTVNLQAIVDRINTALAGLRGKYSGDELKAQGVYANVAQSSRDLVAQSPIVREAIEKKHLTLIQAVYHLESGEVEKLKS